MTKLPFLLAGPILRRTETKQLSVWLATSEAAHINISVHPMSGEKEPLPSIGFGQTQSLRLAEHLHISLVTAYPNEEEKEFPEAQSLYYLLHINGKALNDMIASEQIAYTRYGYQHPHFRIQSPGEDLKVLFGSCRKIHGEGYDCLARTDDEIGTALEKKQSLPHALFLTGDQIYADDVADYIFLRVFRLACQLSGQVAEEVQAPRFGERAELLKQIWQLSSIDSHADNHLVEFLEFAALYLLMWSPDVWELEYSDSPDTAVSSSNPQPSGQHHRIYREDGEAVARFLQTLPKVRRALANLPVYMIFDDHEVTDDWHISSEWTDTVIGTALGEKIISNGLAAFWAFQAWGNRPELFEKKLRNHKGQSFCEQMRLHFAKPQHSERDYRRLYNLLHSSFSWSFIAPTHPRTLFLDTRTQRAYEADFTDKSLMAFTLDSLGKGINRVIDWVAKVSQRPPKSFDRPEELAKLPSRLIKRAELERLLQQLSEQQLIEQELLLVSATPLFGAQRLEHLQTAGSGILNTPYTFDFEAWSANENGYNNFLRLLNHDIRPKRCVILSGDVHYAFALQSEITIPKKGHRLTNRYLQLTASALKNDASWLDNKLVRKLLEFIEDPERNRPQRSESGRAEKHSHFYRFEADFSQGEKEFALQTRNNLGALHYGKKEVVYRLLMYEECSEGLPKAVEGTLHLLY